jgi:hypothetical protein
MERETRRAETLEEELSTLKAQLAQLREPWWKWWVRAGEQPRKP